MSLYTIATVSSSGTVDWSLEMDFDDTVDKLTLIDAKDKTVVATYNFNTLGSVAFKFKESSDGSGGTVYSLEDLSSLSGSVNFKVETDVSADIVSLFINSSDLNGLVMSILDDDLDFALTGSNIKISDGTQIRFSVDTTNDKLIIEAVTS